jgi:indolepyruvate decarboxylase
MRQTIGDFLLRRLEEVGIGHLFGVPGDYNLEFMQQLEDRGRPAWIGNCNELNASYAADAYARIHGLGALVVTNGVGALNAINGIAGAYTEHVPVICICGSVPIASIQRGNFMHHTLIDRETGNFARMFAEVTEAHARLTPELAATEIDRLIVTAWRRKRPVYMELPSDLSYLEIEVPAYPLELAMAPSDEERLASCASMIVGRLKAATTGVWLLDLDAIRFGLSEQIVELAEAFQMRVAVMNTSKGAFPETSPRFVGTYAGLGSTPGTREIVEGSDCLLTIGYRRIEATVGFFTDRLPAQAIHLDALSVDTERESYQGVYIQELLTAVATAARLPATRRPTYAEAPISTIEPSDDPLTQETYWKAMQGFLRPGDVIVVEDGTSIVGAGGLTLPPDCTFVSQPVWGSIGYATPALLGTLLAAPDRRHVLFTGEGSLQITVQEISTMLRHGLEPFIFVINNGGYTVERTILGKDARYNDIANWRYADLPYVFSREAKTETYVVRTARELRVVLDAPHAGLVLVESVLDKYDAPVELIRGGHAFADIDYGPRGPQSRDGVQIAVPTSRKGESPGRS